MKNLIRTLCCCVFVLIITSFYSNKTAAQTGWLWGHGQRTTSLTTFEWNACATDRQGNIFSSGWIVASSGALVYFDTFAVPAWGGFAVTKQSPAGNYLWALAGDNGRVENVVADTAGNLFIYGYFVGTELIFGTDTLTESSVGFWNFLIKVSPAGTVIWKKTLLVNTAPSYYPAGLGIDAAQNIYLAGVFKSATATIGTATLTNTNSAGTSVDVYVAKFDNNGNFKWARSFGGANNDWSNTLLVTDTGDVYLCGQYLSAMLTAGSTSLTGPSNYIIKYDSSGSLIWAKNMTNYTIVNAMAIDMAHNVYVSGELDAASRLGPDTLLYSGGSTGAPGDAFVAKYMPDGTVSWARSAGGSYTDMSWGITVDSCNNVWMCGTMGSVSGLPGYTMSFGTSVLTETSITGDELFIARYDTAGNYVSAIGCGVGGDDWVGMVTDNRGSLIVCGDLMGTGVFGHDTLSSGLEALFTAKYLFDSVGCGSVLSSAQPVHEGKNVIVYPNPASNSVTISSVATIQQVVVYNVYGTAVFAGDFSAAEVTINTTGLPPGTYIAKINSTFFCRFVKIQ